MPRETVWKKIYRHLKEKGFEVYSPGQHKGECQSNYVVIKDGGMTTSEMVSSGIKMYNLLLYVPYENYSNLEVYMGEIKDAMKELFPLVRPSGLEVPEAIDDEVKAYMVSIEYLNYRKFYYL